MNPRDVQEEIKSPEEWERRWQGFVAEAREAGWSEEYLQAFLSDHRVSYAERRKSVKKAKKLWKAGQYRDAIFEDKRTMMRSVMSPDDIAEIRKLFPLEHKREGCEHAIE